MRTVLLSCLFLAFCFSAEAANIDPRLNQLFFATEEVEGEAAIHPVVITFAQDRDLSIFSNEPPVSDPAVLAQIANPANRSASQGIFDWFSHNDGFVSARINASGLMALSADPTIVRIDYAPPFSGFDDDMNSIV